jgi:hypothetical protein
MPRGDASEDGKCWCGAGGVEVVDPRFFGSCDGTEQREAPVLTGIHSNLQGRKQTNKQKKKTNSVDLSPGANSTDWVTATCLRSLVSTFVDRGVSRGQRDGSPTAVNLSFLDRSYYFSFK